MTVGELLAELEELDRNMMVVLTATDSADYTHQYTVTEQARGVLPGIYSGERAVYISDRPY